MIFKIVPTILFLLGGEKQGQHQTKLSASTKTLEVCLSPGCIADGADEILEKMQALAQPTSEIKAGVCVSLCGNGPVVLEETNKKHRKVSEKKLVEILFEDGMSSTHEAVLEAINLLSQAKTALSQKKLDDAA